MPGFRSHLPADSICCETIRKLAVGLLLASGAARRCGGDGRSRLPPARGDRRDRVPASGGIGQPAAQRDRPRRVDRAVGRAAALWRRRRDGAEPELVRRHVPAQVLPVAWHRRARAVPGCAQPVGRPADRRHRLQWRRDARNDLRRRPGRSAAWPAGNPLWRKCPCRADQDQDQRSECRAGAGDRVRCRRRWPARRGRRCGRRAWQPGRGDWRCVASRCPARAQRRLPPQHLSRP